ncbi:hypothetical protein H1R20_g2193, partial [Candolleomyces eurysporus]
MANEGEKAFRSLIETITKDDPQTKLSPEAITRLTEKLGEIVGYDAGKDFTPVRNERGELLNEEGLPIIDITEPLQSSQADDSVFFDPQPLVSLDKVSDAVRERLRLQRNRILDALEQEEHQEEQKQRHTEKEQLSEAVRQQKEAAANEKERLQRAKEMQKKMGKALLLNMAESKQQEEKAKEEQRIRDEQEEARRRSASPFKKKNVTFSDSPQLFSPVKEDQAWGDVSPGRIQPMKRPNLLSEKVADNQTMKMNVVERRPAGIANLLKPPEPQKDSDDESETDVEENSFISLANLRRHSPPPPSPPSSDNEQESDNELEEEVDFDQATLQRQVELEYHRKRGTIGQDAASLIQSTSDAGTEHNTEDTLGISKGDSLKPAISHYRANRLVSAYGATNPSQAASDFIVPAASARTMQNAIRRGKLDSDGSLVGGEDDSASEAEDDAMREVLELLKKGEIYNIGPNGDPIYVLPKEDASTSTANPTETVTALGLREDPNKLPPLPTKVPASKFKLSRLAAGRPSQVAETPSESSTPITHQGRSSPKGASPLTSPAPINATLEPVTIDSPSFAPPPSAASGSAATSPPVFSMIVESPSFPRPTGKPQPLSQLPLPAPAPVVERRSTRPERPPTVLATTVRESRPPQKAGTPADSNPRNTTPESPKKVSKFKRERMQ